MLYNCQYEALYESVKLTLKLIHEDEAFVERFWAKFRVNATSSNSRVYKNSVLKVPTMSSWIAPFALSSRHRSAIEAYEKCILARKLRNSRV